MRYNVFEPRILFDQLGEPVADGGADILRSSV